MCGKLNLFYHLFILRGAKNNVTPIGEYSQEQDSTLQEQSDIDSSKLCGPTLQLWVCPIEADKKLKKNRGRICAYIPYFMYSLLME